MTPEQLDKLKMRYTITAPPNVRFAPAAMLPSVMAGSMMVEFTHKRKADVIAALQRAITDIEAMVPHAAPPPNQKLQLEDVAKRTGLDPEKLRSLMEESAAAEKRNLQAVAQAKQVQATAAAVTEHTKTSKVAPMKPPTDGDPEKTA